MLSDIVTSGSNKPVNNHFINEKFLLEFDPRKGSTSASDWIEKVNTSVTVYGWVDKVKMYLAD